MTEEAQTSSADGKDAFEGSFSQELARDVELDKDAVRTDRKQHPSSDPGTVEGSTSSPKFLIGLARWHPFMAFYLFISDCLYPRTMAPHERVRGLREESRIFYWGMVLLDIVWLLATLIFVAVVAFLVVKKTLS